MAVTPLRKVVITERGWGGHFILNHRCTWRRNTLLELGERRIVVSSVGRCMRVGSERHEDRFDVIGVDSRYMETMAFVARYEEPYWEADVGRQLTAPGLAWASRSWEREATQEYEAIHQNVCRYWEGQIGSLVDREWKKLIRRDE